MQIIGINVDETIVRTTVSLGGHRDDGHEFVFDAEQDPDLQAALTALDSAIERAVRAKLARWAAQAQP